MEKLRLTEHVDNAGVCSLVGRKVEACGNLELQLSLELADSEGSVREFTDGPMLRTEKGLGLIPQRCHEDDRHLHAVAEQVALPNAPTIWTRTASPGPAPLSSTLISHATALTHDRLEGQLALAANDSPFPMSDVSPPRLPDPRPVAVDLFSGAGGLSLGLEQAGFDVLTAVEYDPVHAAVHEYNFPRTKVVCGDVSVLTAEDLRRAISAGWQLHGRAGEWDGSLDLIAGGPPCQGFSTMGKRLVDDDRNRLVFHFWRMVTELRPRFFVMENVPGMMQGGHSGILQQLIQDFRDAGYHIVAPPRVLQAAEYGVPQARRRLFLIGALEGQPLPNYPHATVRPIGLRSRVPNGLPGGPTVADAISDLPDLDVFEALQDNDAVELNSSAYRAMQTKASTYARQLNGRDLFLADLSYPRVWNDRLLTSSMRTAHVQLSVERFAATKPGTTEPVSRFFRLPPSGLCNTLRAGTGSERGAYTSPRPIHPTLPRVISVREAARLHSFPDWFRLHQTKWHGFRQVGNAVPPRLARAVGAEIVRALGLVLERPVTPVHPGNPKLLTLGMNQAALHFSAERAQMPKPRRRLALG